MSLIARSGAVPSRYSHTSKAITLHGIIESKGAEHVQGGNGRSVSFTFPRDQRRRDVLPREDLTKPTSSMMTNFAAANLGAPFTLD